ncbi:hypothetical protein HanXRQr2_Chr08g0320571 [Helianthus annuus]|uniref:Uncharacterized protein n=1 Tax=Helianthus annuus TaxID=4232 RepID=A0A9K3NB63_HELAN|nr:hypothetical protein HanXRQr2_Chr08g0320571 [Helianthus annuus]
MFFTISVTDFRIHSSRFSETLRPFIVKNIIRIKYLRPSSSGQIYHPFSSIYRFSAADYYLFALIRQILTFVRSIIRFHSNFHLPFIFPANFHFSGKFNFSGLFKS